MRKHKNFLKISIICSVVSSICLLLGSSNTLADPPLPTPVGRVVWVKGDLTATSPTEEERHLKKSSVIYLKDVLNTDVNSQAQIVFTDNSLMTFEKNTKFTVQDYQFNSKKSTGRYVMDLVKGGFRTVTGLLAKKNPDHYQVNTAVGTIGVRGTDYVVHLEKGELYMGYYKGSPCVKNQKGELCLDFKHRYLKVNADKSIITLLEKPLFFAEELLILPAKISPFFQPGASSGSTGKGGGNNFCISQ